MSALPHSFKMMCSFWAHDLYSPQKLRKKGIVQGYEKQLR